MKNLMRTAAFRALSADTGAGEGGAAPTSDDALSFNDLAQAAYEAANGEETPETPATPDEPQPAEETSDEPKTDEDGVADAPEPEDDGVRTDDDEPAVDHGVPAEILEKYPAVKALAEREQANQQLWAMEQDLSNPETAPDVLRRFAEGVASHHGMDLATMLGLQKAPARDDAGRFAPSESPALAAPKDWRSLGFDSQAEYDAAADYERAGFASPMEYQLAKGLDAANAQVRALGDQLKPVLDSRAKADADAKEAEKSTRYESAVKAATPRAIETVKASTGWTATPEQVLAAAKRLPQVARESLSQAVEMAFAKEIRTFAINVAKGGKARPADMPRSNQQQGRESRAVDEDGNVDWNALAREAQETVG